MLKSLSQRFAAADKGGGGGLTFGEATRQPSNQAQLEAVGITQVPTLLAVTAEGERTQYQGEMKSPKIIEWLKKLAGGGEEGAKGDASAPAPPPKKSAAQLAAEAAAKHWEEVDKKPKAAPAPAEEKPKAQPKPKAAPKPAEPKAKAAPKPAPAPAAKKPVEEEPAAAAAAAAPEKEPVVEKQQQQQQEEQPKQEPKKEQQVQEIPRVVKNMTTSELSRRLESDGLLVVAFHAGARRAAPCRALFL